MKRDDSVYLRHVLDAISRIEEYLQDVDRAAFHQRYLVQDGVIRQLEIIGEAVKHLSREMRAKHVHIPWQDIAGMRDKLIHHYFGIDIDKVWLTVREEIPVFKAQVVEILDELQSS